MKKILTLSAALLSLTSLNNAFAQNAEKPFDGPYVGFSLSQQNIFAGSFVNNTDFLAQENQLVTSIDLGWRVQLENRFVLGAELQFGFFSGDLALADTVNQLNLNYSGSNQWSYGMTAGYIFRNANDLLAYLYVNQTSRTFDVTGTLGTDIAIAQTDKQGLLRYGVGLDKEISDNFGVRGRIGSFRVDFGNQNTNIDISNNIELNFGVYYQF